MSTQASPTDKKDEPVKAPKIDRALLKDEYISPGGYAFGKTAGMVAVVGLAITGAYYVAFGKLGAQGDKNLLKPYEWWLSGKKWAVENILKKLPNDKIKEFANNWKPHTIDPEQVHGTTKFLVASTVGAFVAKLISIPSAIGFKHEADAINARTAKRNDTIRQQQQTINQLQAQLSEEGETPDVKFTARERSKAGESFVEKTATPAETAMDRTV